MSGLLKEVADSIVIPPKPEKKSVKGVYIEDSVWDVLKQIAEEKGVSVSSFSGMLLRKAVSEFQENK